MTQRIAIYPGTFDPVTNGHVELINKGLKIFDKIIVAVSTGYGKNTMFSLDERKELVAKVFEYDSRVEAISFDGLLVNVAKKNNANVVIRGVRSVSDFEYEFQMASINSNLDEEIQTVFLTPSAKFSTVSSTMIRVVTKHDYEKLKEYVPLEVYNLLQNMSDEKRNK